MKKNIAIKTRIITIMSYVFMALESAISYWMSDVMACTWYIELNRGLTFTQAVQKVLTTPWLTAFFGFEIFVLVPAFSVWAAYMWYKYNLLTRATEN